jgi:hypothetical protein
MKQMRRPNFRQIDRLLSAFEEDILNASDEEIVGDIVESDETVKRVRALIARQTRIHARVIPREPTARRRLLAELLRVEPSLAPSMSATFSGGRTPSDDEVDELIEALLRRGVLKAEGD